MYKCWMMLSLYKIVVKLIVITEHNKILLLLFIIRLLYFIDAVFACICQPVINHESIAFLNFIVLTLWWLSWNILESLILFYPY